MYSVSQDMAVMMMFTEEGVKMVNQINPVGIKLYSLLVTWMKLNTLEWTLHNENRT